MGGDQDRLTDDYAARTRFVAETIPNAALVLYPGVGHNPQFEVPDRFHSDLIRFLMSDPGEPAASPP